MRGLPHTAILVLSFCHRKSRLNEKLPICLGFLFEFHRVGARGGRQACDEEVAITAACRDGSPRLEVLCLDLRLKQREQDLRRLAARRADAAAVRNLCEHGGQIDLLHHLEERVRGIVVFANRTAHGWTRGDAALGEERLDLLRIKRCKKWWRQVSFKRARLANGENELHEGLVNVGNDATLCFRPQQRNRFPILSRTLRLLFLNSAKIYFSDACVAIVLCKECFCNAEF